MKRLISGEAWKPSKDISISNDKTQMPNKCQNPKPLPAEGKISGI
jgi:hypothetical protein